MGGVCSTKSIWFTHLHFSCGGGGIEIKDFMAFKGLQTTSPGQLLPSKDEESKAYRVWDLT
jgi:hypothetical protein